MRKTRLILVAACMVVTTAISAETSKTNQQSVHVISTNLDASINTFCNAIVKGDISVVKQMIKQGVDVNEKSLGMTPVIFAARYNRAKILKVLIAQGADLTIRSNQGYTVMEYAKAANATEAIKVLNEGMGS